MIIRTVIVWFLSGCVSVVLAAQLSAIKAEAQAKNTAVYFTIDGPFTHKLFTLTNPGRVVIDFTDTQLRMALNQQQLQNALIKQVRSGSANAKTLRLVFDVSQAVQVSSSPWSINGQIKGIRLDFSHAALQPATTNYTKTAASQANPAQILANKSPARFKLPATIKLIEQPQIRHSTPVKVSNTPPHKLRDVIVVLDAGHGGKDPGAHGPRNSKEKDVVLAITLKLKQFIDRQPGMRAVLTRSGDYYVGLRERLDIARKYNGDIFVSIHADAFNNPHSNGASVFALSQSGATSEAARWIAAKENYSELGGVNLGDLDDTNGVVRSVLIDLSQTATINSSLQMGSRVLSQLNSFTTLHNNKVEQARFMVLKSPDIPSILVETGFISNPVEERNLTSAAYQSRLSQAIFQGIKGYFWNNPPHGSRIEAMASSNFHVVKAGEQLPAIAARYRVSLAALQSANHLSAKATVKTGQKLVIPAVWA
ncbi:MAG: N-acetylmuramoyl-L-alanine amidase [Legionella sp.]